MANPRTVEDHGCCVCDTENTYEEPRMDLSDDRELRSRHPNVNHLLHDSEVGFLIVPYQAFRPELKMGFYMTGAVIVPTDSPNFREKFLTTHAEARYQKAPLSDFLVLNRPYWFTEFNEFCESYDWTSRAPKAIKFREIADLFVYVPANWAKQAVTIRDYERRVQCFKNGWTGSYTENGNGQLKEFLAGYTIIRDFEKTEP